MLYKEFFKTKAGHDLLTSGLLTYDDIDALLEQDKHVEA